MWFVLCSIDDLAGLWAYQGLSARGLAPLELVSADMLAYSLRWDHRLGADGASVRIELADGRVVDSAAVRGVLNRVSWAPAAHFQLVRSEDREYATREWSAFFVSWLYCLPGQVVNRPTAMGLNGQWRHPAEWFWLAARAGLPIRPYRQSGHDTIEAEIRMGRPAQADSPGSTAIVVGERVTGVALPESIQAGCRRLASLAGTTLLGIDFTAGEDGGWYFAGASTEPDLRLGGSSLLDALFVLLANGGAS